MEEIIFIPHKSLFKIYITEKATDKIILETSLIAYSETEAIRKVKIGSIINELGLTRDDVDFYIKIAGDIYEGKTFASVLVETPALTIDEVAAVHAPELKALAFLNNLPSWAAVSTAVDNIANLADAKVFLKKLARCVYWLAKDKAD